MSETWEKARGSPAEGAWGSLCWSMAQQWRTLRGDRPPLLSLQELVEGIWREEMAFWVEEGVSTKVT